MLRDLVDLVHSLHSQFVFSGDEVIENFNEALELEESRLNGNKIPNQTTVVNKLFYTSNILSLPDNIQSYINFFGKENVKFIHLNDIKNNPSKVYSETLDFLNVDTNFIFSNYVAINRNKTYRSKFIRDFIKKYSISLGKIRSKVFKKPIGLIRTLEFFNKSLKDRELMSEDLHKKLLYKFSDVELKIKNIIK